MNIFENSIWRVTKMLLTIVGLWPFQSLYERRILSSITLILLDCMLIPEVFKLVAIRGNTYDVIDCVPMISLHLMANIKIFNCFFHLRTMKRLLHQIQRDWRSNLYQWGEDLLQNDVNDHKKIIMSYTYSLYIIATLYITTPAIPIILDYVTPLNESRPRMILYRTEFYVNTEKYTVPLYFHSCIVTFIPVTIFIAFDSMYANAIQHACNMFKIIGNRLQFLINDIGNQVQVNNCLIPQGNIHTAVIECIWMHKEILQFADLLQSNYTTCFFIMTALTMVTLGITGYQVLMNMEEFSEVARIIFFMNGQMGHLFFRCWFGQKLINHSEFIREAVYQSKWYDVPFQTRKLLVLVMIRGTKQSRITAGHIYRISIENFGAVIKTSLSYFTLFRSMQ